MNKVDYERLQQIVGEVNEIMYRNELNEIRLMTENRVHDDNTNEVSIRTRRYAEKQASECRFGNKIFHSDNPYRQGFEYDWAFERFISR